VAAVNESLAIPRSGVAGIPLPRPAADTPVRAPVRADERLILILSRDAEVAARERTTRTNARVIATLILAAVSILTFDVVSVLHAVT